MARFRFLALLVCLFAASGFVSCMPDGIIRFEDEDEKTDVETPVTPEPEPEPEPEAVIQPERVPDSSSAASQSDVHYGVQIMGLGRKLGAKDPALKGLSVKIIPPVDGGKIYKYVAAWSETLPEAKAQLSSVRKKFPDAFVVKVEGNTVSRVK